MDALAALIPLMPLITAAVVGVGNLSGVIQGERGEPFTALISTWTMSMAFLLSAVLSTAELMGLNSGEFKLGTWLDSDTFKIEFNFITAGFGTGLTALFSLLLLIITRFSVNYLHKETGFHRYFFVFSLFSSAVYLLFLSGNAIGTFFGWEISGLCSYFLIAFAYDRPIAVGNATRVYLTNRVGDVFFILAIGLSFSWIGSVDWTEINNAVPDLTRGESITVALCFAIAGLAKSAQLPFSPWLARALEGPTPSSAAFYGTVMIHSGVFLVIRLEPLMSNSVFVMGLLALSGAATVLYGFICGLTQNDVKSSFAFAKHSQLGMMFLECGLGFWQLAGWHLCAHAIVRCYLVLNAPSFLHNVKDNPVKPVSPLIAGKKMLFIMSLQRFWLEQISDWAFVKPVRHLARDLSYFDDNIVNRLMGIPAPAVKIASSLAQAEENRLAAGSERITADFTPGTGLIAAATHWIADLVRWFEVRMVLQGIGKDTLQFGRQIGHLANKFETRVLRPRYLVLLVFITLLVAF